MTGRTRLQRGGVYVTDSGSRTQMERVLPRAASPQRIQLRRLSALRPLAG